MASREKFIEQIVCCSANVNWNVYPRCLFFGVSRPLQYRNTSIERQAAVISGGVGSVILYKLFVGDTYESTGLLGSYATVHYPRPLEIVPSSIVVPGLVTGESAVIDPDGQVTTTLYNEVLTPDLFYREQLGIHLALLTLEC